MAPEIKSSSLPESTAGDEDIVMEDWETVSQGSEAYWNDPSPSIHTSTYSALSSTSRSSIMGSILYIPDPSHEVKSKNETKEDLGWATCCMKPEQYEVIKELSKFVYKLSESKEGVKVVLGLVINMEEYNNGNAFKPKYMKSADFKTIVLNLNSQQLKWNELIWMDCIIGGIDYMIDFQCNGHPYGLNEIKLHTCENHFALLSHQVWTAAVKWETLAHLEATSVIHNWVVLEIHIIGNGDPINDAHILK
ncbi:hypothetical protein BKA82DRAFT_4009728 [Pisolithus tinctorius]|nr:hypothetical protein BKA82DRAFT_4009728 [Pisolithus tinctorius]